MASQEMASAAARTYEAEALDRFLRAALQAAGADTATTDAVTRALMHGSLFGMDTHGVRLLPHYLRAIRGGRVNATPSPALVEDFHAVGVLDGDDGHGALNAYVAADIAIDKARRFGIGVVSIRRSSHFGPAGAFALHIAEAGMVGLAMCNSDSFMRLQDGAQRFHGTNPLAAAAPVAGGHPWLLDMATSSIPFNRVRLMASLGLDLQPGVASDHGGVDTTDPHSAVMLAPIGGPQYGYKGAGIAGLVEILSSVLGGALLSPQIAPMVSDDMSTPRNVGAFVLAIDPEAFGGREAFLTAMQTYRDLLRGSATVEGGTVRAPGDRAFSDADRRPRDGVPVDPDTIAAFAEIARTYGLQAPQG